MQIEPKIKTRQKSQNREDKIMTNYRTADLYLSSFLMTKGCHLRGVNEAAGQKHFLFEGRDIDNLIGEYFNNGTIPVLSYKAALRDLRTIIKNGACFASGPNKEN